MVNAPDIRYQRMHVRKGRFGGAERVWRISNVLSTLLRQVAERMLLRRYGLRDLVALSLWDNRCAMRSRTRDSLKLFVDRYKIPWRYDA